MRGQRAFKLGDLRDKLTDRGCEWDTEYSTPRFDIWYRATPSGFLQARIFIRRGQGGEPDYVLEQNIWNACAQLDMSGERLINELLDGGAEYLGPIGP